MSLLKDYITRGWGLLPIRPKGHVNSAGELDEKAPFVPWAQFKSSVNNKPSLNQIQEWIARFDKCDWGVLTGYENLTLVDVDDPNLYDLYLSERFTKCVMRTPSGGISFLVKSVVVPKNRTRIYGVAVDLKGSDGYAILPSRDLTPKEIADEEQGEKDGTKTSFTRHWIDDGEPEEVEDIYKILGSLLPTITPDVKPAKGVPTATQWFREHNFPFAYDGGRYIQVLCPFHDDNKPSMTIYSDGFYCHSCQKSGGLFSLIKTYSRKSDEEIIKEFPGIQKQNRTLTDAVIELVESKVDLLKDHNNASFFKFKDFDSDIGINLLPITSKVTRYWIAHETEKNLEKLPPESVISYVVKYFDGKCSAKGQRSKIFRRIGGNQEEIWYDLGSQNFVRITKDLISVLSDTYITFVRETNQGIQKVPKRGNIKNILKIFDVVNVKDDSQKILLLTWIVNAFLPWAQSPILLLCGARGSGKSYMGRIIKRLIDPVEGNTSELLVNKPKDIDYLMGLLSHNAVAVLDNISRIDRETSDILCNVVTGGVIPKRELYTTNDQILIDIKSRLIVTAINSQIFDSGGGDLAERTVAIEISRPEGNYLSEEYLNYMFEGISSEILGAVFELVKGYLNQIEDCKTSKTASEFRLTTYASVGKYITEALDLKPRFDVAYRGNQSTMSETSLEAEPITEFVTFFAEKYGETDINNSEGWGMPIDYMFGKIYSKWLTDTGQSMDRNFPTKLSALLTRLKRIEPDLSRLHSIRIGISSHRNKKWIKISKPLETGESLPETTGASNQSTLEEGCLSNYINDNKSAIEKQKKEEGEW